MVEVFHECGRPVRLNTGYSGSNIGKKAPADRSGQAVADLNNAEPWQQGHPDRPKEGSALTEIGQRREILLRHLWRRGQDGKAATPSRVACFPVGFPLDLHVALRSRHQLQRVVLASGGSERLYRKPVLSWREIMKKGRAFA
jgi:hypothetical protein